ncbi:hypothetical protein [Rheinheimera nanhaiensis]|uniref:Uncharacterized protein n=1 Tax=Rheinheimera nanhaiensis E407-8 TaxID=562729 RepID=I1DTH1_9GAMM|nr:hypothetical protein [Rheinheimera nanhaiensis]GAB57349.1 hypothetical protein RNAN_0312 [Rheinheimera nanhaiensis E407-8]
MPETLSNQPRKIQLSEGVVLGIIPVVVYALGFSYESGYLSYYGIPSELIAIDAPAMIRAAVFGAIYAFVALLWLSLAVDSSVGESYSEKSIGIIMLYLGFFPVLYLLSKGSDYLSIVMMLSFGIIFLVVLLRKLEDKLPWLQRASVKTHALLAEAFQSEDEKQEIPSLFGWLQKAAALFLLTMIPFVLAFTAGKHSAEDDSVLDVFERERIGELAVIRIYGDKVIAIPFHREKQEFRKQYVVFEIGTLSSVVFTNEHIGPLKEVETVAKPK